MADEDVVSEGELEDGEVVSSEDEEGPVNAKVCLCIEPPFCWGAIYGHLGVAIYRTPLEF